MGLYSFLKQKLKVEEQIDEGESMDVGRIYSEVPVEKGEHSKPKEEKKKQEEVRQYVYPEFGLLENTSKNFIEEKDVRERSLLLKRALNAIGIDITIVDMLFKAAYEKNLISFADAGYFIIEKQKAGMGMLQRVFKIGFNRAARIMDQLCQYGVVSEEMGTKPRSVLMTQEEFEVLLQERVGK